MGKEKYTQGQIALFIIINIILLALIAYASTSLTVSFFGSIGSGEVKTSNLIMGLVNDSCKIFLPLIVGVAIFKKKYFHAAILVFIIVGTMYISYLASQALDLNVSNKQLLNSSTKTELVTARDNKQKEVTRLNTEKNDLISPIKSQINELPTDYISKKVQLQKEIKSITATYASKIKDVQDSIDTYNTKIENYKVDSTLTTEGYHALSKHLGVEIGVITKWKNIFMEILAIILSVNLGLLIGESEFNMFNILKTGINKLKDKKVNPTNQETPIPPQINNTGSPPITATTKEYDNDDNNTNPNQLQRGTYTYTPHEHETPIEIPEKKAIGFELSLPQKNDFPDPENKDIHEAIRVYCSTVLSNLKHDNDFKCIGLDAIVTKTLYNRDALRKAKDYLEHSGVLVVKGLNTYIIDKNKLKTYA
jgi:phage host-nuclease inhibitor protein Gam